MSGTCRTNGEMRTEQNILARKFEGEKPLGRPKHRWEGNIKAWMWIGLIWFIRVISGTPL